MCGFIGVEKNDEMYEKSDEFFKIFQLLFKQIEQALPKSQKKAVTSGVNSWMAELVSK